jgi:hypothetical protein
MSLASTSLVEHRVLNHVKDALRVILDWDAPEVSLPRKLSSLQFTMKSFSRHLDRVMKIEEEGGYLDDIVAAKPNLESRIMTLHRDHLRFRTRLHQIGNRLDSLNSWHEDQFAGLCMEIYELLDEVDRHDAREIDLLQESLLLDEGGEG